MVRQVIVCSVRAVSGKWYQSLSGGRVLVHPEENDGLLSEPYLLPIRFGFGDEQNPFDWGTFNDGGRLLAVNLVVDALSDSGLSSCATCRASSKVIWSKNERGQVAVRSWTLNDGGVALGDRLPDGSYVEACEDCVNGWNPLVTESVDRVMREIVCLLGDTWVLRKASVLDVVAPQQHAHGDDAPF